MISIEESIYDFDELKMYFGEDYWVTDKIYIKVPTIGDILEFGDSKFYSMLRLFCANPTALRLQLWKIGIDWNEISDFQLFSQFITKNFTSEDTKLLFGDLNFSYFECLYNTEKNCDELVYIPRDKDGNVLDVDDDNLITIDEFVYKKMIKYLCTLFDLKFKVERAKNKVTKQAIIEEDEMNLNIEKQKNKNRDYAKSHLLPLISSMVNHPGFKYKTNELKDIGIYQFMDSVRRLQVFEDSTAMLKGIYSGFVDAKQIDTKKINWLRDLNE